MRRCEHVLQLHTQADRRYGRMCALACLQMGSRAANVCAAKLAYECDAAAPSRNSRRALIIVLGDSNERFSGQETQLFIHGSSSSRLVWSPKISRFQGRALGRVLRDPGRCSHILYPSRQSVWAQVSLAICCCSTPAKGRVTLIVLDLIPTNRRCIPLRVVP